MQKYLQSLKWSDIFNKRNGIIGGVILTLCGLFYYFAWSTQTIIRIEGRIPYIWCKKLNQSLKYYVETQPSKNVILLAGGYQTGKSRAMDLLAQKLREDNRMVIRVDASLVDTIEEFLEIFKIQILSAISDVKKRISSGNIKSLGKKLEYAEEEEEESKQQNQADSFGPTLNKLYSSLTRAIDDTIEGEFSDIEIGVFLEIMEKTNDILHPVIFIHSFDKILSLGSKSDPHFGQKLVNSAKARLSRRNLYSQNVPIILEIHNSLLALNTTDRDVFRYLITGDLRGAIQELVINSQIFNSYELKKIQSAFGNHGGCLAKMFESLRFGMKIDEAISQYQNEIDQKILYLAKNVSNAATLAKQICDANGVIPLQANTFDPYKFSVLFENGYLYLSQNYEIKSAHKGITKALCSLSENNKH